MNRKNFATFNDSVLYKMTNSVSNFEKSIIRIFFPFKKTRVVIKDIINLIKKIKNLNCS